MSNQPEKGVDFAHPPLSPLALLSAPLAKSIVSVYRVYPALRGQPIAGKFQEISSTTMILDHLWMRGTASFGISQPLARIVYLAVSFLPQFTRSQPASLISRISTYLDFVEIAFVILSMNASDGSQNSDITLNSARLTCQL